MSANDFGPWAARIDAAERAARCRELRAIVALLVGKDQRLAALLRAAESDGSALDEARLELDRMAALPRRRILTALAHIGAPR